MGQRIQLQTLLEDLLGSRNVYFQPPETVKLSYPCIIYSRDNVSTKFADDQPYNHSLRYQLMIIDRDPDSGIPDLIAMLPMCRFERHYTKDNLNHDVYSLYY
jgi:hypothetical protein